MQFTFTPRNRNLPPISLEGDVLGIAMTAADHRDVKFVPIGYSIAEDGPITVSGRNAKKVSRILIRVARNLSVMQRPDYVESLLLFAATLLDSRGGELTIQR
jgi:hypothetical protein